MTYRALVGLSYPDIDSLAMIRYAGGLSTLARDDPDGFTRVRLQRVEAGDVCEDVPEESVGWLLAQGFIERIHDDGSV